MRVDAGVPLIAAVDDGIGFDANSSRGLGLPGTEERLPVGRDRGSPPNQEWVPRFPPRLPGVSGIRCAV
jgi:hypothetical protein